MLKSNVLLTHLSTWSLGDQLTAPVLTGMTADVYLLQDCTGDAELGLDGHIQYTSCIFPICI